MAFTVGEYNINITIKRHFVTYIYINMIDLPTQGRQVKKIYTNTIQNAVTIVWLYLLHFSLIFLMATRTCSCSASIISASLRSTD